MTSGSTPSSWSIWAPRPERNWESRFVRFTRAVSQESHVEQMLWQSCIVSKQPGAKLITWHTDDNYLHIERRLNFSAWIALDETTEQTQIGT
jgi:hypothetical protein